MIRAAVYGATGYTGAELLRLLLQHPDVTVVQATSRDPGLRLDALLPGLRGLTDLVTSASTPDELDAALDVVFLALPHGCSSEVADAVAARAPAARLIDLAQDFRTGHEAEGWVYGLPELFPDALPEATRIAVPGCFATAILLATGPALAAGYAVERVIVDAKTGSSGSGNRPQATTHHPVRAGTVRAYKVFDHQHETEIRAAWARLTQGPHPPLAFVPQSVPLVRGIYACCYLVEGKQPLTEPGSAATVGPTLPSIYQSYYASSSFVRVVSDPPNVLDVRGTNNADVYVRETDGLTLVIVAIDNLVRGAAGQAVQCMNLAFGIAEDRGLRLAAMVV